MKKTSYAGINRTGNETHPIRTRNMIRGMEEFPPSSPGDATVVAGVREEAARHAPPIGSMPPLAVDEPSAALVLLADKMGARLAFERSGVRLYEAILSKYDAYGSFDGGPSRDDLERIHDEELSHMVLLWDAVQTLGGDPTAVTPSADLQTTASMGVVQAIVDARTTLVQSLETMLVAELADTESWQTLVKLARDNKQDELGRRFEEAEKREEEHVASVRRWLAAAYELEQA